MYPPKFTYLQPCSLNEALKLLANHAENAAPLAGGQSLLPFMKLTQLGPDCLVDLNGLGDLSCIERRGGYLHIGAMSRHSDFISSSWEPQLEILRDAARVIGDVQIRNRGTIGGSLVYADPAGDWAPVLLALDSSVKLRSSTSQRSVPLSEFFLGEHETIVQTGELVVELVAAINKPETHGAYLKLARRQGDYAVASVAVQVTWRNNNQVETIGIGLGGVAETPIKATTAETFLRGKVLDSEAINEAATLVMESANPSSDFRGSAHFRKRMAGELFTRAVLATINRRSGGQPLTGYI